MAVRTIGAALALVLCGMSQTEAALPCGPYDTIQSRLKAEFKEQLFAAAINRHGAVLEVWINRESGTWTVLTIAPFPGSVMACLVDSGDGWREQVTEPGDGGA